MLKSICFISRNAHHVLLNQTHKKIGGAEFQEAIIAKALRDRGWRVSFITEMIGKDDPFMVDGINLIAGLDFNKGNRISRRILRIPTQLWRLMKIADAQVYYQRNPGPFSSLVGIFSRINNRRFVIAGASDANFNRNHELNISSKIDRFDIKFGIRFAHLIILQNRCQRYLLKKFYSRDGLIFYNFYEPPLSYKMVQFPFSPNKKPKLLWAGRLSREKHPELCIRLAKLLPDFEIVVALRRRPYPSAIRRSKRSSTCSFPIRRRNLRTAASVHELS